MDIFEKFIKTIIRKMYIQNITWQDLMFQDNDLKNCILNNKCLF